MALINIKIGVKLGSIEKSNSIKHHSPIIWKEHTNEVLQPQDSSTTSMTTSSLQDIHEEDLCKTVTMSIRDQDLKNHEL